MLLTVKPLYGAGFDDNGDFVAKSLSALLSALFVVLMVGRQLFEKWEKGVKTKGATKKGVPVTKESETGTAHNKALEAQKRQIQADCTMSKSQDMYNVGKSAVRMHWTKHLCRNVWVSIPSHTWSSLEDPPGFDVIQDLTWSLEHIRTGAVGQARILSLICRLPHPPTISLCHKLWLYACNMTSYWHMQAMIH